MFCLLFFLSLYFYSEITSFYIKCFVLSYSIDVVLTLSYSYICSQIVLVKASSRLFQKVLPTLIPTCWHFPAGEFLHYIFNSLRLSDAFMCGQTGSKSVQEITWPLPRPKLTYSQLGPGPLGINVSEILFKVQIFLLRKKHLKMLSTKWQPFCLGLNMLFFAA